MKKETYFVMLMRRSLLNFAICHAAFILGTIAAIAFLTPENGNKFLSHNGHHKLNSESPKNNVPTEGRETESDGSKVVSTKTSDQAQEIKSENRHPIFEIWKELDGSVPIRGRSLYFRLYDDGTVEFDYVLLKRMYSDGTVKFEYEYRKEPITPPPYTRSVEASLERAPLTKISEAELSRFKSLKEDLVKSRNIKKEYKYVALTLDVITKLTILLNENETSKRKIIINDSEYDVMSGRFEKIFPNLIVNLIKEIHLIRDSLQEERKDRKNSEL